MFADLRMDWNIHSGIMIRIENTIRFYVSDYISTYIDYRLSSNKDSRNKKKTKRANLANTLRNTMLLPMASRDNMTRKRINNLKEIPELTNYLANI
jgi:hypothetical protein